MKRCILRIFIIALIILLGTHYSSFVEAKKDEEKDDEKEETTVSIDTDITSEDFTKDFSPNDAEIPAIASPFVNTIVVITEYVLGIIQIIGVIAMVLSIAVYGFNKLISADSELTSDMGIKNPSKNITLLKATRGILIGSVLLFSSATIVRIVFNLMIDSGV